MGTAEELRARLETLRRQLASGVASVTADGNRVEYRSLAEIEQAIRAVETLLAESETGTAAPRVVRMYQSGKGL